MGLYDKPITGVNTRSGNSRSWEIAAGWRISLALSRRPGAGVRASTGARVVVLVLLNVAQALAPWFCGLSEQTQALAPRLLLAIFSLAVRGLSSPVVLVL